MKVRSSSVGTVAGSYDIWSGGVIMVHYWRMFVHLYTTISFYDGISSQLQRRTVIDILTLFGAVQAVIEAKVQTD